jgi:TusA-related sulfurtransferase
MTDARVNITLDANLDSMLWQQLLDAQGLQCPLPLLKAKRAISQLAVGEKLKVLATDAGSEGDFAAWTKLAGHYLHQSQCIDGVYHYLIEKA